MIVFDVTDLIIFIIGGLAVFFLLVEWIITRIKTAIRKNKSRYERWKKINESK